MSKTKYVFRHEYEDLQIETYDEFTEGNRITLLVTENGNIKEIKRIVQYNASYYGDLFILYKGNRYFLSEFDVEEEEKDGEGN